MIYLELPVQYKHIAESIPKVFQVALGEGLNVPEYQFRESGEDCIALFLPDRHIAIFVDELSDCHHQAAERFSQRIGLRYLDVPVDERICYAHHRRTCEDSAQLNMRYSVLVDIFSQALPEKISEQWYLSEQDETRSLISRVQMSQPHDVFKANHLSWFLALLILDFPLEDVFILARAALNVSRGTWPKEIQFFPKMNSTDLPTSVYIPQTPFPAVDASLFDLYPVVNEFKWVKNLLAQSVKTVQLRVKEAIGGDLITQIRKSIELGRTYDAQVFINDYWQIAIDENAYGIHLGQEDLLDADLEWIHAAGIRLGISTHSYFEILIAEMIKPSYIALGHIFPTSTKQMPSKPQGLVRLNLYQQLIHSLCDHEKRSIPTVAIGGIDLSNLPLVMAQGVDCVAVVRAITQANDVIDAVSQFKTGIHQAKETYDAVNDRC